MISPGDNFKIEVSITKDGNAFSVAESTNRVFEVWQFGRKVFTVDSSSVSVVTSTVTAIVTEANSVLLDDAGLAVKFICDIPDNDHAGQTNRTTFVIENPTAQAIGGTAVIYNLPVSSIACNGVAAAIATFAATMTVRGVFEGVAAASGQIRGSTKAFGTFEGIAAADASMRGAVTVFGTMAGVAAADANMTGTAFFDKAANSFLWLESDAGVTLNGSTVETWEDQSNEGHSFTQDEASKQLDFNSTGFTSGGDDFATIETPSFASQLKSLPLDGNKSDFNFMHQGTQDYIIFSVNQGYDGVSGYSNGDISTEYNPNVGSGPGVHLYRGKRFYINSASARGGDLDDNNSGVILSMQGLRIDGATKTAFIQIYGRTEQTDDMSSFVFDSGDSQNLLTIGGQAASRQKHVAYVIIKDPTSTQITEWTNYFVNKYNL